MLKPQIVQTLPNVENFLRHCQRKDYKAKAPILKQGDAGNSLYLILDGSVSVQVEDEADPGHMLVVAYLNPGDFIGEMGLCSMTRRSTRSAMVVAKTQCEVAEITYERFHQIRGQFPDILYAVSRQLASRLRQTTRKLTDLAFVDVSGRIAHTLLDLCKAAGCHDPPGRHADQDHAPGARQDRGLLARDGGSRTQEPGTGRSGVCFR